MLAALGAGALLVTSIGFSVHRNALQAAILRSDPESILGDPRLKRFALGRGRTIFEAHCASCHGASGQPDQGFGVPDLTDDDNLYGSGKVAEIEDIARYGIRAANKRGWNLASMPAFASPRPYKLEPLPPQSPQEIEDLTQHLLSFTGRQTDQASAERGARLFRTTAGCWDCHGYDAGGDPSVGAPSLSDSVWLYGGSHDAIRYSIAYGRAGTSPAFARVLTAAELRDVAVFVASLAQGSTTGR